MSAEDEPEPPAPYEPWPRLRTEQTFDDLLTQLADREGRPGDTPPGAHPDD